MIEAAIWLRVSTEEQDRDNQEPDLLRFCEHHGYTVAQRYELDDSAWNGGGTVYRATIRQALDDAYRGTYKVLVVWALDRLTRGGAEELLRLVRQFRERGVIVVSYQEPWMSGSPEVQDVLLAFAGWMNQQESKRKSERVKAALAKRKANGLPVGRVSGAKDSKPRKRAGYVAAWGDNGARRKAQH